MLPHLVKHIILSLLSGTEDGIFTISGGLDYGAWVEIPSLAYCIYQQTGEFVMEISTTKLQLKCTNGSVFAEISFNPEFQDSINFLKYEQIHHQNTYRQFCK